MKDRTYMLEAIVEMDKSQSAQKIGAVLVKDDEIIGRGYKTRDLHAERMAINDAKAKGKNVKGATIYTTLEPCVNVGKGQIKSCSELIIDEKIKSVVIGSYDPNSKIRRKGWKMMKEVGVKLFDFEKDIHEKVIENNKQGLTVFQEGYGPRNGARFDFQLNGGKFIIKQMQDSDKQIETRWTLKGINGIYAYAGHGVKVARADFAESFDDIDEIHQFDFESYSVPINVGEICIFQNNEMSVLIKVLEVKSGPKYGSDETAVKIRWQVLN